MIVRNLLIGLPAMLLSMVAQVAFAFWSVRYYVRHSVLAKNADGGISGIGPLLIAMLVMMSGTVVQIVMWGLLFVMLGEFRKCTPRFITRPSTLRRWATAISS